MEQMAGRGNIELPGSISACPTVVRISNVITACTISTLWAALAQEMRALSCPIRSSASGLTF